VILAWVISLLLLCSSLITYIERLSALRIIEVTAIDMAQKQFIAAEKAVQECEEHITTLSALHSNLCVIQSVGNNRWLISSKEKPSIQIGVLIDEKTSAVTRINWRQVFE
jgi:predicted MPP superfamily phosphohydrolase